MTVKDEVKEKKNRGRRHWWNNSVSHYGNATEISHKICSCLALVLPSFRVSPPLLLNSSSRSLLSCVLLTISTRNVLLPRNAAKRYNGKSRLVLLQLRDLFISSTQKRKTMAFAWCRVWHNTLPFRKATSAFSSSSSSCKKKKKTLLFLDFFQFGTLNFPTNLCNNAVNSLHICTCIFSALFSRHRRFVPLIPNDRKNVTVTVPLEYLFVGGTMYLLD